MVRETFGADRPCRGFESPRARRLEQVPALDGLRGVAVLAVIALHTSAIWPPILRFSKGGHFGVDLFFVLSGFLITALLLRERNETGRIGVGRFWGRRAVRLLPALIALLAVHTLYLWSQGGDLAKQRTSVLSALFYLVNWRMVWGWPANNDLGHLWSLSIEEQFYLVWPLLLLLLLALRFRPWAMVGVLVALIVAINLHRLAMLAGGVHPFVVNLRTDGRVDGPLFGCLAAVLWVSRRVPRRGLSVLATVGLLAMVSILSQAPSDGMAYSVLRVVFYVSAVVVVLAVVEGVWFGSKIFDVAPLRAVGKVSYGLYLWHIPVMLYVNLHIRGSALWKVTVAAVMTVVFTLLSWFLVERPAQRFRHRLRPVSEEPPTASAPSSDPGPDLVLAATDAPAK